MTRAALTRRNAIAGIAGAGLAASLPLKAHDLSENPQFRHGVASGDPDATSVVLWTRLSAEGAQTVDWQIASDPEFTAILAAGEATTGPDRDYTVKVLARDLAPGRVYYYRFISSTGLSPVGRARTLPTGALDRLSIALVSCSNYPFGFFNAYEAIARDAEVDFVLHTGDYIYEYGQDGWGDDVGQTIGRRHQPAHEIVSLADYRQRHAQYKTDTGSRAMHAAHTLLACWDDHESANNPWTGGAQNHQGETEGDWSMRRAASIRAYYEYMPVREPEWLTDGRDAMQFWRSYSFGNLATLNTLETRHTARAQQIDYWEWKDRLNNPQDVADFRREVLGEPGRLMLAPELEAELTRSWTASLAAGQPWRLIGNPMPIARTDVPDVVAMGVLPDPFAEPAPYEGEALLAAQALALKGRLNLPFYPDTWDGYPWARERLYDLARAAGASDLLFLTGDSHSFWANDLKDAKGRPVGLELGTAGVTSPGDFVSSGFGAQVSEALDRAFEQGVPEVVWTNNLHQGYIRLDLARDNARASFMAVDTVTSEDFRTFILQRLSISREDGALAYA